MKITFKAHDPRAGMTVEINDTQARQHIEAGNAVEAKAVQPEDNKAVDAAPENKKARK